MLLKFEEEIATMKVLERGAVTKKPLLLWYVKNVQECRKEISKRMKNIDPATISMESTVKSGDVYTHLTVHFSVLGKNVAHATERVKNGSEEPEEDEVD